jgi:hypothetical protein
MVARASGSYLAEMNPMKRVLYMISMLGVGLLMTTGFTACEKKKEAAPAAAPAEQPAAPAENPPANP